MEAALDVDTIAEWTTRMNGVFEVIDLKPLTNHLPKPMIKILDKPLIQFAVDRLTHCGIQEIIIVIPKDDVLITSYFQETPQNSHIDFVNQTGKGILTFANGEKYAGLTSHWIGKEIDLGKIISKNIKSLII